MQKQEARLWVALLFTLIVAGIGAMGALVELATAEPREGEMIRFLPPLDIQNFGWLELHRYPLAASVAPCSPSA